MKIPDHQELWRDAINDAAPDAFVAATLALTIAHAHRTRRMRRVMRITAGATVALVATWFGALLFPSIHTMAPNDRLVSRAGGAAEGSPLATAQAVKPVGVSVRYLTDDELLDRFPGQPVGLVGSGASREFLVLANP